MHDVCVMFSLSAGNPCKTNVFLFSQEHAPGVSLKFEAGLLREKDVIQGVAGGGADIVA